MIRLGPYDLPQLGLDVPFMNKTGLGQQIFLYLAAALLLLTAMAKLVSLSGDAHVMDYPDPLLGLSNRQTLLLVAGIELVMAGCMVSRLALPLKYLCAAWLGGEFLIYRLALAVLKPGTPCKCLGTLTGQLHISERTAGWALTFIAAYLVFGALWFFALSPRTAKLPVADCGLEVAASKS